MNQVDAVVTIAGLLGRAELARITEALRGAEVPDERMALAAAHATLRQALPALREGVPTLAAAVSRPQADADPAAARMAEEVARLTAVVDRAVNQLTPRLDALALALGRIAPPPVLSWGLPGPPHGPPIADAPATLSGAG